MNTTKDQISWVSSHGLYWENKCTNEKGLLKNKNKNMSCVFQWIVSFLFDAKKQMAIFFVLETFMQLFRAGSLLGRVVQSLIKLTQG